MGIDAARPLSGGRSLKGMFGSQGLDSPKKIKTRTAGRLASVLLPSDSMKYIAVLLVAGGVYLYLGRPAPVKTGASSPPEATGTDFLKAPLDRTHEVLKQARGRADDPALQ